MPYAVSNNEYFNRPDVRRASLPASGGIMNARAIARHFAMLASHGELGGTRVLSPERVDQIRAPQTDALDVVTEMKVRKALGYFLGGKADQGGIIPMGSSGNAFGSTGSGGSIGFADVDRKLGFGLTKNLTTHGMNPENIAVELRGSNLGAWNAAFLTAEAIREQVDVIG